MGKNGRPLDERLMERVRVDGDGCWMWLGHIDPAGYGRIKKPGSRVPSYTHRVSYELHVGPIPPGLQIDHLCRNRACLNPAHLEVVTLVENVMRGFGLPARNARKTHCKHGHEFTEANTQRSEADRACRACGHAKAVR